ncbi:MAG: transglycosylase SLT domain-containing protein, partial [Candidatus Schmidhempelia sp.]|nr:transglycosylase SLT domain-containing protein [Candidatus Schmidhempelia sp.]
MWKFIVCYTALLAVIAINTTNSYASTLTQQRDTYQLWQANGKKRNDDSQIKLLNQLKSYPLYPYALFDYLSSNMPKISADKVVDFINQYNDTPLANDLKRQYIKYLNDTQQWANITAFPKDNSIQSNCYYQFALYQLGHKKQALAPIESIWLTGKQLPSACDAILNVWDKEHARTANMILLRIELALKANNMKLARYLTNLLPDSYKTTRTALLAVFDDPKQLVSFSDKISYSHFTHNIVINSFSRLARHNPQYAKKVLPKLITQQHLNADEYNALKRDIAWQLFNSSATQEEIQWRDQIIAKHGSVALIEKRIRLAIREQNDQQVLHWIALLPKDSPNNDDWRYWQAKILKKQGNIKQATSILQSLANGRGFYAMLSAQSLNKAYHYNLNYTVIAQKTLDEECKLLTQRYKQQPTIQRIIELRYWGNYQQASREWRYYLSRPSSSSQLPELARYAYLQNWGEYSVQATIAGKLWNNWVERFPVVHMDTFKQVLNDKHIPMSYSLAIARQESALAPTVSSPAGARGLMQLMPATAKETARKITNFTYQSPEQLYEPETNILLGTYYLDWI